MKEGNGPGLRILDDFNTKITNAFSDINGSDNPTSFTP